MIRLQHQRLLVSLSLMTLLLHAPLLAAFDKAKAMRLTCGKTSAEELVRLLGKPKTVKEHAGGAKTWVYQEEKSASSAVFTVQLDPAGIVVDYSLEERIAEGMAKRLDPANFQKIHSARAEAEVEALLGKPAARSTDCAGARIAQYHVAVIGSERIRTGVIGYDRAGKLVSISGGALVDDKRWTRLMEGKSKEAEVIDLLGEPASVIVLPDGNRALSYFQADPSSNQGVAYWVGIDPSGVAADIQRLFYTWDADSKVHNVGVRIDSEGWRAIRRGATTESEVVKSFGLPTTAFAYPDGQKRYVYRQAGEQSAGAANAGTECSISFDASGTVTATGQADRPSPLRSRLLDAGTKLSWSKCDAEKPAAEAVRAHVGEPVRAITSPDGATCLLYLYELDGGYVEMRWAGFDRTGRWLGVQRSETPLGELNALGRQFARVRWSAFQTGQTGVAQVVEALGAPAHILESNDRSSTCLYVAGQLIVQPQVGAPPTASQSYSVYTFTFDDNGVLKSFEVD